jgi:cell division transport system ATP-binding protein
MWLELRDAVRRFGERRALDGVSYGLEEGEIGCLLGPSGCGKTTALRCIAGLETLDSGEILSRGRLLAGPGVHVAPHERGIGLVFQDHALFPHLTVCGNVEFGLQRLARGERRVRASELLELVGLAGKEDRLPHQLSGGEQQRVSVARAFVNRPLIMLADEPTGNLDPATGEGIMRLLDRINKTGTTVVMATHDQRIVNTMRKRVIQLDRGVIVRDQSRGVYGYGS